MNEIHFMQTLKPSWKILTMVTIFVLFWSDLNRSLLFVCRCVDFIEAGSGKCLDECDTSYVFMVEGNQVGRVCSGKGPVSFKTKALLP